MPYADPEAQRKYQREWRAARRAEFLADKSCAVCGSIDRMEVDHVDPSIKLSHKVWSWSRDRREEELAKCQVLCHDHHLEKTLRQRRKTDHGQAWMYQGPSKCRCDKCCAWKAASDRKYRGGSSRGMASATGLNPVGE